MTTRIGIIGGGIVGVALARSLAQQGAGDVTVLEKEPRLAQHRTDLVKKDTGESLRWPGAWPLAKQHWRMGVDEISGSLVKPLYFKKAQKFIPELKISDLAHKTGAGVRAQAWGRKGELLDDFAVDQVGPVTVLRNAPSPAATSSIAIAEYLIENYLASPA